MTCTVPSNTLRLTSGILTGKPATVYTNISY